MIVNGQIVPVAGRVSMDWTILDVSKVENVKVGDDVTVFGKSGELEIRASELARLTDTISYEITCSVSGRVPRVYL
jgi:alanine racemase